MTVSTNRVWPTKCYLQDKVIKFHFCPFPLNVLVRALSYHVSSHIALRVPRCEAQHSQHKDCIEKPRDYIKREKCLAGSQLLQLQPPSDYNWMRHQTTTAHLSPSLITGPPNQER